MQMPFKPWRRRGVHLVRMKRILAVSCLVALHATALPGQNVPAISPDTAYYQLTVSKSDMRSVVVNATFTTRDSLLLMVPYGMEHLPDGWRTFVHDEVLRDAQDRSLPLTRIDKRRWRISTPPGSRVHLSYTVRIEHDRPPTNWFPGPREAAYARDWGIFALGRALFVIPSFELPVSIVTFSVPVDWRVAAALPAVNGSTVVFRAETRRDLIEALFFVGDYLSVAVRQGPLTFDYAVAKAYASSVPLFDRVTRTALQTFRATFGVDPSKERYLVVVNPEYQRTDGFGGAFRSGFSMTFPFVPDESNIGTWAFTLTHETFHLWNALTIVRASSEEEWFLEGSADYYTALTLARSGITARRMALGQMAHAFSLYRGAAGRTSLAGAGAAESRNGDLLYKGGWTILAALDLDIRRVTADRRSLDDVLRALVGRGGAYRNSDLLEAANTVSGSDYTDFFKRYVTGVETLDPAPYLAAVGLSFASGALVERADATAAERARLASWVGAR